MNIFDEAMIFGIVAGLVAVIYSISVTIWALKHDEGSEKMKQIAKAIQEGATAFLNRQYRTVAIVGIIIFALILIGGIWIPQFGILTASGFLLGAILSALAGYLGMFNAVRANIRTAQIAHNGVKPALKFAFKGGSVTGLMVLGLGVLGISIFMLIGYSLTGLGGVVDSLIGFAFGCSLISVFARLGGGIYTKAADVGADLVGKVEAGIPEDDPRNPAVIADQVGDNVGDCAGMAADVFETFAVTIIASILLAYSSFQGLGESELMKTILYPLLLGGIAVFTSIIGVFFVSAPTKEKIMQGLYKGLFATGIISAIAYYFFTVKFMNGVGDYSSLDYYYAALVGLVLTGLIIVITDYFTSTSFSPVKSIAKASTTGHGTNIIAGLAVGQMSTALPVIAIVFSILLAYHFAGFYGIAIAASSMLSMAGMVIAVDSFGPITDNAGGIAEMSELPGDVRETTDALDAVGNTTKAVTKGYAIGSAALAAIVLFGEYSNLIKVGIPGISFSISKPEVLIGLFLGAMLPYIFASLAMKAVGKAAGDIVVEVRRQFKEIPGIMEGTGKPEYGKCVDIVTKSSLREMILPAFIPIAGPIIFGLTMGPQVLGGILLGTIISGLFVAISMTSGGAAWDNAKKLIERGLYGGKGSEAHKAAVTGDTVGDPYKDTAGPAINPMIKVVNIFTILIIPIVLILWH
ncbi:MAG: sodium-translocating pyrophosphatase [Deltaproteobacteria bacterium]|jgi:K(+)-stimulated pyrophosphate-energized sodium pump|nr:sodium-translocating pyrophosphatase [Deltaproteobacteria bacterium]MCL5879509.1 sodium-translocating pyrophosphatase [Deltaproteobacteria bacterium]MDA8305112.1 sodium-translocating pyrophosphatase [Deltaproteobacteria bacterium]